MEMSVPYETEAVFAGGDGFWTGNVGFSGFPGRHVIAIWCMKRLDGDDERRINSALMECKI